jgi:hypothetical protein
MERKALLLKLRKLGERYKRKDQYQKKYKRNMIF